MKKLSRETFRANLRTWAERANSEEQINQRLCWKREAIDFHKKMVDTYKLSNEVVGELMSALYKKS